MRISILTSPQVVAYIQVAPCEQLETREVLPGALLADYAPDGTLVGIELLDVVPLSALLALFSKRRREGLARYFRRRIPGFLKPEPGSDYPSDRKAG